MSSVQGFYKKTGLLIIFTLFPLFAIADQAKEADASYRVALFHYPFLAEPSGKGVLFDLLNLIELESGINFEVVVAPLSRSMKELNDGKVDMMMPMIDVEEERLGQAVLSDKIALFDVHFVIYSCSGSSISRDTIADLADRGDAIVVTDEYVKGIFPFPIHGTHCVECSLKMLNEKRVDAVIFSMVESDKIISDNELKNIKKDFYQSYPVRIAFKDEKTKNELEDKLDEAIASLSIKGEYQKLLKPYLEPFSRNISGDECH